MNKTIIYFLLMSLLISCNKKNDVSNWSDSQINDWFNQSGWVQLTMKPDSSINKRLFVEQNILNPTSWEAALKFLKESDFNSMELGRYELADDGTYANIEEYATKDTAHFEAHKKFIDIQYLAKGKEYVYVTPVDHEKNKEVTPYHETKDIAFFDEDNYTKHLLSTGNFLVLFPSEGHKPCMKVDSNEVVRKVVVKIPVKIN
ncbi:MAG: YhcH/YjgK/YiaL family protein [Paludibacter sp.]|nr:YhcH/YjgK/YiaL family protein [Paludibacter sp.]MDD4197973.1 YhcH/YjgK/YiaL family protein [Paludibacter sp.]MDD4427606.1 YhcH/YjgK/YiaL family protein [Paludibacter sp.]